MNTTTHGCEQSLLAGHETFISFLKPFDGLVFGDPVVFANTRLPRLALAHLAGVCVCVCVCVCEREREREREKERIVK